MTLDQRARLASADLHERLTAPAPSGPDAFAPDAGRPDAAGGVADRPRRPSGRWVLAAALIVFVVAILGVVVGVRTHDDPASFVDDRPMTPAPSQPAWLGPDDPRDTLMLGTWQHDQYFAMITSAARLPDDEQPGAVRQVAVQRGQLEDMPGIWTTTTIQGRPAVIGQALRSLIVRFELGDGWIATVTASGTATLPEDPGYADAVATLEAGAEALSPQGPEYWLPIIDGSMANGRDGDTSGYRLGLSGARGRSYATYVDGTAIVTALVVPGTPTNTFRLFSATVVGTAAPVVPGDSVRVRGHDGTVSTLTDPDGTSFRILTWNEDGYQHRLRFPETTGLEDARRVADHLERLTDDGFAAAVFPAEVPADLRSDHRSQFRIPDESNPGVVQTPPQTAPTPDAQTDTTRAPVSDELTSWCAAVEAMRSSGLVDPDTGVISTEAIPFLQAIIDVSPTTDLRQPVETLVRWLEEGAPEPMPAEVSAAGMQTTRDWATRC